jgi:choline dehydrogenase
MIMSAGPISDFDGEYSKMTGTKTKGDVFDYIVVGSGAGGSVVAGRLLEDSTTTVCVLESGPPDTHPYIHVPAGFIKIMFNPKYTWQFKAEPTPLTNGRAVAIPIGRTVGGSSSINGMVINRGQAADFNSWAQQGNRNWGYADVLPYFKKFERRVGEHDDVYRGKDGKIPVTDTDWRHPISEAFIAGAAGMGIPRNPDYNGASQFGVGYFQRGIQHGLRRSAARQFLLPARKTGRLDLRTHARAEAILFEGKRAVGVRYRDERDRTVSFDVRARREVIIAAGTINTPRLLQMSGIGAGGLLNGLGVPVVQELPGVGENFRDHYSVRVVGRAKNIKTMNELSSGPALMGQILRWATRRPSILGLSPSHVHVFWRSPEVTEGADLQVVFTPASYKAGFVSLLDDFPGMSCGLWQHRPESTGYVRARTRDPFVDPEIQPNYLSHPVDRRTMIGGVRLARKLLNTPELAPYMDHETLPGTDVETDDEILEFLRQYGSTVWHLIGTSKMGPRSNPMAVVDDELRVHGISGLRVVDASIMPSMPSANTYASTLMIAEKGADMIRGRPPMEASAMVSAETM